MDGEISIPRSLQTDRIAGAVSKRERHSGNSRRFQAELARREKSPEDPDHEEKAESPPEASAAAPENDSPPETSAADPEDRGLLDFEA